MTTTFSYKFGVSVCACAATKNVIDNVIFWDSNYNADDTMYITRAVKYDACTCMSSLKYHIVLSPQTSRAVFHLADPHRSATDELPRVGDVITSEDRHVIVLLNPAARASLHLWAANGCRAIIQTNNFCFIIS